MVASDDAENSLRLARLMGRAQDGDREAFRELFEEIGPLIGRFVRRRMTDRVEAEVFAKRP
jgi:DNA-directed RNA polymerase specialized sigma24 family protein